ncbi:MAG: hypothetical protein WC657_05995 [Candidatus Paceibacterota bacterium]
MAAKIIEDGYSTAGFNSTGKLVSSDLALVRAEVPGEHGDWIFVVIGTDFCWVKGLPANSGYLLYKLPLTGPQSAWQEQINAYAQKGPDESLKSVSVPVGTKTALAQPRLFILSA